MIIKLHQTIQQDLANAQKKSSDDEKNDFSLFLSPSISTKLQSSCFFDQ